MKFPLGALLDASGPMHTESNLGGIGVSEAGKSDTPVVVEISVEDRRSTGFRIVGTAKSDLIVPCDRCLADTKLSVSGNFEVWVATEDEPDLDEDIIRLAPGDDEIALDVLVGEAIRLAIPSKIVCRENCTGLCPVCGQDLNIGQCDCNRDQMDDRWAALLKLKAKFKE